MKVTLNFGKNQNKPETLISEFKTIKQHFVNYLMNVVSAYNHEAMM